MEDSVRSFPTEDRVGGSSSLCRKNDALQAEGAVQKALCRGRKRRGKRAASITDLPPELQRRIVEALLRVPASAGPVLRDWLSMRMASKQLWETGRDLPLDLHFDDLLTAQQVAWLETADVKVRKVRFARGEPPFRWLERAQDRREPTVLCRSADTLEELQGLVLTRGFPMGWEEVGRAHRAWEGGPGAPILYDLRHFSKLKTLSIFADRLLDHLLLPAGLESLHLGCLQNKPITWNDDLTPPDWPALRNLHVQWTCITAENPSPPPWHGEGPEPLCVGVPRTWVPLLVPSLQHAHISGCMDEAFYLYEGVEEVWPRGLALQTLVFTATVLPFDLAVRDAEEVQLEEPAWCVTGARDPPQLLRLMLCSPRLQRLVCRQRPHAASRCGKLLARGPGPRPDMVPLVTWNDVGDRHNVDGRWAMREVLQAAGSPEFRPYISITWEQAPEELSQVTLALRRGPDRV
eukprot:jgi/Botrbrau1/20362/Bobra.0006s0027.1